MDADGFAWRDVFVRGIKHHLREIDGDEYEKILKLSVIPGTDGEKIDLNTQYKLMLAKSCVDPKLSIADIGAMPFRKRRTLLAEVVILHFGDEDEGFTSVRVPDDILVDVMKLIAEWAKEHPEAGEDEGEGKESSSEDPASSAT